MAACLLFSLQLTACARSKSADSPKPEATASPAASAPESALPADTSPPPSINAERAMQYTREVTAFGPRPIGSENHRKLEQYIYAHLKGVLVEDDMFTADTVEGKFPVRNIIAKFPGTQGWHYRHRRPL